MSKLEQLIKELCPDGVEYKELGEIGFLYTGLTGKTKQNFIKSGNSKYVSYKNIFDNIEVNFDKLEKVEIGNNENQKKIEYGDVLFTGSSEIIDECGMSSVFLTETEEEIYLNSFSFGYRLKDENLFLPEFLKYLFRGDNLRKQINGTANGVTRFNISKKLFIKIKIPIPPLEVQEEIVRILDQFTKLSAELSAELSARKAQYEYYQNSLLNFDKESEFVVIKELMNKYCPDGVEYKELQEIGFLYTGLNGKTKQHFIKNGNSKYVSYKNIFNNNEVDFDKLETVEIGNDENQKKIKYGDVLFTGSSEIIDECGMSSVFLTKTKENIYLNSFSFGYRLKDENLFLPEFLKYLFRGSILRKQINGTANGVTRFNISKKLFSKIKIPIPPLEVQAEIVKILDKFHKLTTDINEGIPAEIELRNQQYEYYRNKLLTFKEL